MRKTAGGPKRICDSMTYGSGFAISIPFGSTSLRFRSSARGPVIIVCADSYGSSLKGSDASFVRSDRPIAFAMLASISSSMCAP